ncbi:peptidase P60 [Salibacterium salarium]|uniref:Peptidase P60 n=1 Tax=Salibacterium salarium TaxID=284579 RepID=A0A3R9QFX3_9BACI|nr:C40 family peptidase [Salibacterium salarium]RSL29557.1 peptidase P60 [Salibacterium salarium]
MLPPAFAEKVEDIVPVEQDSKEQVEEQTYVDVSVMSVWAEPNNTRKLDAPALSNPVQPWEWTESMTLDDKLWLVGNLDTQALYGMEVEVLKEEGDWTKVAVEGQSTPLHEEGYPGWVPSRQLSESTNFAKMQDRDMASTTASTAFLYEEKELETEIIEVSFNTRLPVVSEQEDKVMVATPSDGNKWMAKEDITVYEDIEAIPAPSATDLVETAESFMGLPYLWAGVSGFGFDCSGFTHSIYKAHGITIPRDSSVQAEQGEHVARSDLQAGDLVFFARNGGTGDVHHVGMYIGNGEMIHSPNSRSTVEKVVIDESDYANSYHSASRYLPNES